MEQKEKEIVISVCIITYNHEKYIRHALESVLMQKTDYTYEIIVSDDCSQDSTVEIIRQIQNENPDRITLLTHEKNLGMCVNSYTVRLHARGKYIAMLEGDDFWVDEFKLQKQADFLESHPECSAMAGRMRVVNEREHPLGKFHPSISPLNRYFGKEDALRYTAQLLHPGAVMYRNFIRGNEKKYSWIGHSHRNFGGDMILVFILADIGKIYITDEVYGAYRFVRRLRASNANSLVAQEEIFWEEGKVDVLLYIKKHMGKSYDFAYDIALRYLGLKNYLKRAHIPEGRKIMLKYFKLLTPKEKMLFLFLLIKEQYQEVTSC